MGAILSEELKSEMFRTNGKYEHFTHHLFDWPIGREQREMILRGRRNCPRNFISDTCNFFLGDCMRGIYNLRLAR
jgi:hypothetical protein